MSILKQSVSLGWVYLTVNIKLNVSDWSINTITITTH